jgi:hypothetical protein
MEQRRSLVLDSSQSSDTLVEQRFMMRQRELLESSSYTLQKTWSFRPTKPKAPRMRGRDVGITNNLFRTPQSIANRQRLNSSTAWLSKVLLYAYVGANSLLRYRHTAFGELPH